MNHTNSNPAITPIMIRYQQVLSYVFLLIAALLFFNMNNETWALIKSLIADAYIQVSSFVAGTLLIFFFLEKHLKIDVNKLLRNKPKLEVLISS
ncbi:MAG: hypothetical protein ISQ89_06675, partial [Alphaproteobacteria bacterium]|nr:hypothetical protein [Alphaproteobacteria bacterium]